MTLPSWLMKCAGFKVQHMLIKELIIGLMLSLLRIARLLLNPVPLQKISRFYWGSQLKI